MGVVQPGAGAAHPASSSRRRGSRATARVAGVVPGSARSRGGSGATRVSRRGYFGGIVSTVPIFMLVGTTLGLAALRFARVTPYFTAMAHIVSPFFTV